MADFLLTSLATRLSPGASGLHLELLAPLLQGIQALLGPSREVNVDRGPHSCKEKMLLNYQNLGNFVFLTSAQVGGAGVDVAELGAEDKVLAALGLDRVSDGLDAAGEALEDALDVAALLHGDDPKLIFLIDPDQEGLGLVVENAPALGPVALHAGHLQKKSNVYPL